MRFVSLIFVLATLPGCIGRSASSDVPPADTELAVTHPSILRARFEDVTGSKISAVDLRKSQIPAGAARIHAWASGLTPVKRVYLESLDSGRRYDLGRRSDKEFILDLGRIVTAEAAGAKEARQLRFKVVAIDIDNDVTVSDDLGLTVREAPSH